MAKATLNSPPDRAESTGTPPDWQRSLRRIKRRGLGVLLPAALAAVSALAVAELLSLQNQDGVFAQALAGQRALLSAVSMQISRIDARPNVAIDQPAERLSVVQSARQAGAQNARLLSLESVLRDAAASAAQLSIPLGWSQTKKAPRAARPEAIAALATGWSGIAGSD